MFAFIIVTIILISRERFIFTTNQTSYMKRFSANDNDGGDVFLRINSEQFLFNFNKI